MKVLRIFLILLSMTVVGEEQLRVIDVGEGALVSADLYDFGVATNDQEVLLIGRKSGKVFVDISASELETRIELERSVEENYSICQTIHFGEGRFARLIDLNGDFIPERKTFIINGKLEKNEIFYEGKFLKAQMTNANRAVVNENVYELIDFLWVKKE